MATAKKLPSGSWRVQVFDYVDEQGKRHYRSFTSSDPSAAGKREAEFAAASYALKKGSEREKFNDRNLTVRQATESYIDSKASVLSPSTIAGYHKIKNLYMNHIFNEKLKDLTSRKLQIWINGLASKYSPKTCRNAYGLMSAMLDMFCPDSRFRVTLPAKIKPQLNMPSDSDVTKLLEEIRGTEMEAAVLLAAFGPMRRGEICGVKASDIKDNTVVVRTSMVRDNDGKWVLKQPKTYSGYRSIVYPADAMERILETSRGTDRLLTLNPDQVSCYFPRILDNAGIKRFRFHDLRHYSASIMHAIGIPDQYIMARGGWNSDQVLKDVYRDVIDEQTEHFTGIINTHFKDVMQHEMQHDSWDA